MWRKATICAALGKSHTLEKLPSGPHANKITGFNCSLNWILMDMIWCTTLHHLALHSLSPVKPANTTLSGLSEPWRGFPSIPVGMWRPGIDDVTKGRLITQTLQTTLVLMLIILCFSSCFLVPRTQLFFESKPLDICPCCSNLKASGLASSTVSKV